MRRDFREGDADGVPLLAPGDYGKDANGIWWARVPETGFPSGKISKHQVTEHEDGTITASPSILMHLGNDRSWHGYLEKGIWRKV